jgi:ATP-dependent RNA helicase DeaD
LEQAPSPTEAFDALGLDPRISATVVALGFTTPTPIQQQAIPPLIEGRDLIGRAATGTGKTAAFGLPLLHRLAKYEEGPRGLVLVPTRELAAQVSAALTSFAAGTGTRVLAVYGGAPILTQTKALQRGVDVVVATPGRAVDLMNRGALSLDRICFAVLDEADEMLDLGFAEELEVILAAVPETRQQALFSATLPQRLQAMVTKSMKDPVRVDVAPEVPVDGEAHRITLIGHLVHPDDKPAALARVLAVEAPRSALVFCRTREDVDSLAELLVSRGQRAEALHGGLSQAERDKVIARLRTGAATLVVATDVAARGLDVEHVTHVVHYDLPESAETWVHRTGRTGRAGREGTAIALVTPRERRRIANLQAAIGRTIDARPLPTAEALRAVRLERLREQVDGVDAERDAEALTALRAMVAAHGGDPVDLAARALRVLLAQQEAPGDTSDLGAGEAPRTSRYDGPWTRLRLSVGRADKVLPGDLFRLLVDRAGVPKGRVGAIKIGVRGSSADVPPECVDGVVDALRGVVWGRRPVQVQVERSSG